MTAVRILLAIAILLFPARYARGASDTSRDAAFREGWRLLVEDEYGKAREKFLGIPPGEYDLGDYVLYFTGLSFAREGKRAEAAAVHDNLAGSFPGSPLLPYLAHALAYAAALDNDMAAAKAFHEASRRKVTGNGRKAEEGYVAARLLEAEGPSRAAAEAHLENFAAQPAQDAALLSMERLKEWRREGKWKEWGLPAAFYGRFAKALALASDREGAREAYAEALAAFPASDNTWPVLISFAELLRKMGETTASRDLLDKALREAPPAFRNEVAFLRGQVDWKSGRLAEARSAFLAIADEAGTLPGTADRARYMAAWISSDEGDVDAATEEFGKLAGARDGTIRHEAIFRHAFGRYRQKRYAEAVALFAKGEKSDFSSVERARHSYWKAVATAESGDAVAAETGFSALSVDPGAGPYALFAARRAGRSPYAMLEAPSSEENGSCGREKEELWEKVLNAEWDKEDAARIRRTERLVRLGIAEYAVLEISAVSRGAIRKAIGLADGGSPGLIRYLAGDLRGAIRETNDVANDPGTVELIDRIQYPLAPEYVGDCDRRKSGVDPLVLHSVIRQESQFQPNALSPAGAVGLMQLLPGTASEVARREKMRKPRRKDLLNPRVNVALGAAYLSRLLREYRGDYLRAVAAYNAGESAVAKWWEKAGGDPALFLESVTYRETRFYVRRVFLNVLQYYLIYRPKMFSSYFPTTPKEAPRSPGALSSPPSEAAPAGPPMPAEVPAGARSGG